MPMVGVDKPRGLLPLPSPPLPVPFYRPSWVNTFVTRDIVVVIRGQISGVHVPGQVHRGVGRHQPQRGRIAGGHTHADPAETGGRRRGARPLVQK